MSVIYRNPAGIGEHSDIMEAMQGELDKIAMHEDRLDILNNYFNEVCKLVWKRGEDYIIYNPPRKSEQWEEWQKLKEKEKQDEHKSSKKL